MDASMAKLVILLVFGFSIFCNAPSVAEPERGSGHLTYAVVSH